MKSLRTIALLAVALSGCTSGIARYSATPMMLDGRPVCCRVEVANGKEIGHIKLHLERRDGHWTMDLEETNVEAFRGQKIAADAAARAAKTAAAVLVAPAAGAVGAAAIGAIAK